MDTPQPAYQTGGRGYGSRVDTIHAHPPKSKARTFLPWIILGLLALAVIGWLVSRSRGQEDTTTPATTEQSTTPTNQNTQTNAPAAVPMTTDAGVPTAP